MARHVEADMLGGIWVDPDAGRIPFGEYATRWVAERPVRPRTREIYAGQLRHIVTVFNNVHLCDVHPVDVRTWHGRLSSSGLHHNTENAGVPQHVIQQLLGHASPRMTARYAQIHDSTVRDAFERYCHSRVNTAGEALPYDPDAATADAEWAKHNLSRIHDSLPNGYCGRPPQQDCPHPNACLTCPDFQTTPEFLEVHRQQTTVNRKLIARADANGQFRLLGNLRRVQDSLDQIIPALEALENQDPQ